MLHLNKIKFLANRNAFNILNTKSAAHYSQSTKCSQKMSYEYCQTIGDVGYNLKSYTIPQKLAEIAEEQPNDVAYKFCMTQQSFTFSEVKQRVDELAQNLLNMGFIKGDNIAVLLPNIPEAVMITLAAASIGAVVIPMNPAYQLFELKHMLKKIRAKGLFILENVQILQHYELLKKLIPSIETSQKGEINSEEFPYLKHVIVTNLMPSKETESKHKGTWSFNEVKLHNSAKIEMPYVDIDDDFAMMFTSGSTGLPKAAVLKHSPMVNKAQTIHQFCGAGEDFRNLCIPVPIFHVLGLTCGLVSSIANGNKTVFPHLFPDTLSTIKALHNEKCTGIKAAPTIYMDIINHPELKNYDMSHLRTMMIGASVIPKDLLIKTKEVLGLTNVLNGYAMTESGCAGTMTHANDINISEKVAYESVGRNLIELKIRDPQTGELVPRNTDGEICLRGFSMMSRYYDDEEKTAETLDRNGWLLTGDIGQMDDLGYVYFKSRAKEVIIRGGINIYPSEIEAFLRTNPSVLDCYVVGIPDQRTGEEVCVWIKLRPEQKPLSNEDVREYCKGNLAYFKVPKYIKFVEAFPVSATAKVQKYKMVDQMKKELGME